MDLVLWRHAHAEDITQAGGNDMDRGLTARGLRQAKDVGTWLHQQLPSDAVVLASPALRAVQTARALQRDHALVDTLAPDRGTVQGLLDATGWSKQGAAASSRTVVFVGHQPVLGMAAALLMCGQAQGWSVKKGAAWWLRSGPREGACELWMVRSPLV